MRYALVSLIFILSCSQRDDFSKFSGQLKNLKTPISFRTIAYPEELTHSECDADLFNKFKYVYANEVLGKLFDDSEITAIVYTVYGDVYVPVLVTYDKKGNKVDSLNLFENASGFNPKRETFVFITINPDKTIQEIDSTKAWTLDETGENRVQGTEVLAIDTITFRIDADGKIIKNKRSG